MSRLVVVTESGLLALTVAVLLLLMQRVWIGTRSSAGRQRTVVMNRADDRYWNGFFYNNPDDPELFVPRRYGIGWALNFGHPQCWPFLTGILLVPLILLLLTMLISGGAVYGCHSFGCHP